MHLTPRRAAFAIPLALAFLSCAAHQGANAGYYRTSRPDCGARACFPLSADGYIVTYDGIPTNADAPHIRNLAALFRGAPPEAANGIMDERPLVPFLQSLLFGGAIGGFYAGALANLAVALAATACAVDLGLALGCRPLVAGALGCLLGGVRGVGFYAGVPDVHLVAFLWLPIGGWLHERLELDDPAAPFSRTALFGLAAGAAGLTYLGDGAVLAFLWLRGLGRAPLARLAAATTIALATIAGWHVAGRAAGLRFSTHATGEVPRGAARLVADARSLGALAVASTANAPRDVFLARPRAWANAVVAGVRALPGSPLAGSMTKALVPAFGWPLLLAAAAGFALGRSRERRVAVALFLPPIVLAWPVNANYDAPRVSYPAVAGLLVASLATLAALERASAAAARRAGAGDRCAAIAGALAIGAVVVAFLLHENRDLLGDPALHRLLQQGL